MPMLASLADLADLAREARDLIVTGYCRHRA
jgi:hypothetical protein